MRRSESFPELLPLARLAHHAPSVILFNRPILEGTNDPSVAAVAASATLSLDRRDADTLPAPAGRLGNCGRRPVCQQHTKDERHGEGEHADCGSADHERLLRSEVGWNYLAFYGSGGHNLSMPKR